MSGIDHILVKGNFIHFLCTSCFAIISYTFLVYYIFDNMIVLLQLLSSIFSKKNMTILLWCHSPVNWGKRLGAGWSQLYPSIHLVVFSWENRTGQHKQKLVKSQIGHTFNKLKHTEVFISWQIEFPSVRKNVYCNFLNDI